ncbi:hypothetical protein ABIB85_007488 [Bradyrhizobium sp. JR1.5]|uniref:DUF7002 family protein n=1 Tax=unclassified Bradyrhizobium TaxID=2631580 RepID=UPI0024496494|nr:hypothetical protein [Bradyrhizobium sp. SSUT18]MDH2399205.1 hypothetical protein [Bradyrhizobium sp. SSUT18]
MKEEDLLRHYPRLWHMAEDGSWDSIRKHGLLSTSSLLDLYGYTGKARRELEAARRPESVLIASDGLPHAIVRDQKPMTASALEKCLTDGTTPAEWFKTLNSRVFFWLSKEKLRGLLDARAYRDRPQTVLTLDTASLVGANRERVRLSPINSGATIYNPAPRGLDTFLPISDFPFEKRRKTRTLQNTIVELTVLGGVSDIRDHAIAVHSIHNGKHTELWRRKGTNSADGP